METNAELELAYQFVLNTNKNVFLTGKAGTGKTTFLQKLRTNNAKRIAVVAPTGVAAINAGGVTIHSLFQLPFGPFIPDATQDISLAYLKKFRKEKINLLRSLDLLVIDEISMVRADMLDGIDSALRRYRNPAKPFGGLQLLMIGDLHQLPPIIKDEEWKFLSPYYDSVYFFHSKALKQTEPVVIELKKIYRQSDQIFIDLLNQVRDNTLTEENLEQLNNRYIEGFSPEVSDGFITLTTHNNNAQTINNKELSKLSTAKHTFSATVKGEFSEYSYPTDFSLELKEGAQVMFIKNDITKEKLYYNGKIGIITEINDDGIFVKTKTDLIPLLVRPVEWQNIRYTLGSDKQVHEEVIGTFSQFPLRLAWAITIHKSQGLTFEKAIIDAQSAFAHGQVYVALSRCKTYEGMVLSTKLQLSAVKTDKEVANYSHSASEKYPSEQYLIQEKKKFQSELLTELFDYYKIIKQLQDLSGTIQVNLFSIDKSMLDHVTEILNIAGTKINDVYKKFKSQLDQLFAENILPEENEILQGRVIKGIQYFLPLLNDIDIRISNLLFETDNKAVFNALQTEKENTAILIFEKIACLKKCAEGFNAIIYLQTKANAQLDFEQSKKTSFTSTSTKKTNSSNNLIDQIKEWRNQVAKENDTDPYMILPQKAIKGIVEIMPVTLAELAQVSGIGNKKLQSFGEEIVKIVSDYVVRNNIERAEIVIETKSNAPSARKTSNTHFESLELFKQGKSIKEISEIRKFALSTIEGHLSKFVMSGEIDILELIEKRRLDNIINYYKKAEDKTLNTAKSTLGEDYGYGELRLGYSYFQKMENNPE